MSSTNPFDPAGHLASLWGRSGDALLDAQRSLVQELAGWMPSVAPEPAAPDEGYEAARRAFDRSWETALDVSRAAAANLSGTAGPALGATLDDLLDPAAWFARVSGRGPALGGMAATTSLAEAATLVRRRRLEHDVVMVEAWMQAAGAFARALHAAAGQGTAPASPEAVTALWSEHADPIFAEAERSEAFRRSREELAAARADLETAQRAAGQVYGYATRRDLDDLRDTVARLRRHFDEVVARREPAAIDVPPAAMPIELGDRPAMVEPPRYVVRSSGGDGPALLLVGPPDDQAATDLARSLVDAGMAAHEVVWSEAAWGGPLEDLVRDLASTLDDIARHVAPVALAGIGPGAIPLACLATRRDLPALVMVDAAFAFGVAAQHHMSGPDWLATIRRDDALMRGTITIGAKPVDLAAITCPVLNLVPGGADDRAETSRALGHLVASDDYTESRFSNSGEAGRILARWLADRQRIGYPPGHKIPEHEVS